MWQKMQPFIQTKVPNTPLGYWLCGLKKNDVRLSCSRWGTCCDNAVERSFFATLKGEMYSRRGFATRKDAIHAQVEFIEGYYNRKRSHSTINNKIPAKVMDAFL